MTWAQGRFRTSSEGYDRGEVDAFVRAAEDMQAQLQEQVAHLEAAVVNYQQRIVDAEELEARLADHQRETDVVRNTRQHLESWLASSIPVLSEYQAILREVGREQPSSAAALLDRADATAASTGAPGSRHPKPAFARSARVTYLLMLLVIVTAGVPAVWYLRIPVANVLAAHPEARVSGRLDPGVAQTATPVEPSEPRQRVSPVSTVVAVPELQPAGERGPEDAVAPARGALTISMKARGRCWFRVTLDGKQKIERVLRSGEEATFNALEEAVLRVGNAGAIMLTINGLAAAPLGRQGEVITTRITPANYTRFTR